MPYEHELAYCSRSGPPQQPWLEPDILDRLESLKAAGCPGVVVVPIGFVSITWR
jgi:ferrochelatase